eukprot:COSAG01_NODE_39399_length_477_cov_0.658730_1_plen_77_part_10
MGGLAAGSVELRADGSLREWTITNQSPAGGTKVQLMDHTILALDIHRPGAGRNVTKAIRTHPPPGLGPGAAVDALTF